MDRDAALRTLADLGLGDAASPESWHWKVDGQGGFLHRRHPEFVEIKHISAVRAGLSSSDRERLDEALSFLSSEWEKSSNSALREASDAITLLLRPKVDAGAGFRVPDLPLEEYTEVSDRNLLPQAVEFALSRGGVLQSARECVRYRMRVGKEDLNHYYLTRTVCIYYQEGGRYFVAFDDDPLENILLPRA